MRLSSLDPTTRALGEGDMFNVGVTLGKFLRSAQSKNDIEEVKEVITKVVESLPLFSEEWLPDAEVTRGYDPELMMKAMIYWSV